MKHLLSLGLLTCAAILTACGADQKGSKRQSVASGPGQTTEAATTPESSTESQVNADGNLRKELTSGGIARVITIEVSGNSGDKIVFRQRDKANTATVKIVMPDIAYDKAEGEIIKDGKVYGARFKITAGRKQTHSVKLPRAAKNIVKVYLSNKGASVATGLTTQIVVGDIFLIAGQSNSTNAGEGKTRSTSGGAFMYNGKDWAVAVDPMPIADGTPGSSSWPTFADHYYRNTGTPAGIVSLGYSETLISYWQPKYWLFQRLSNYAKAFGKKGFRAVLWHQGESDVWAGTLSWDYRAGLQEIIRQLRANLGWNDLPFVVANTSYPGVSGWSTLCSQLGGYPGCAAKITNRQNHVLYGQGSTVQYTHAVYWGPNSDALWENKYRSYEGGAYIHLNELGHKHMGWRWYDKVRLLPAIK